MVRGVPALAMAVACVTAGSCVDSGRPVPASGPGPVRPDVGSVAPPDPDLLPPPDLPRPPRRDTRRGGGGGTSALGEACARDADCRAGDTCLTLRPTPRRGVCVRRCTPDKVDTPLVDEDTCPKPFKCGTIQVAGGRNASYCFQLCRPRLGGNPCSRGIACTYRMAVRNFGVDVGVCGAAPCTGDADCLVTTPTRCSVSAKNCPTGEICVRPPGAGDEGICSRPGKCDLASGLCGPRATNFKAAARVGDPCKSDLDCGRNMICQMELSRAGRKRQGASCASGSECCGGKCVSGRCTGPCWDVSRNGYCIITGCGFPSLKEYQCPAGSACHRAYRGGVCLKRCSLSAKIGETGHCRGNAYDRARNPGGDFLGDYECRDWSGLAFRGTLTSSVLAAPGPLCEWGSNAVCSSFPSSRRLTCNVLAGRRAAPGSMYCMDPATGKKTTNPEDPTGICGDATGSGPIKR